MHHLEGSELRRPPATDKPAEAGAAGGRLVPYGVGACVAHTGFGAARLGKWSLGWVLDVNPDGTYDISTEPPAAAEGGEPTGGGTGQQQVSYGVAPALVRQVGTPRLAKTDRQGASNGYKLIQSAAPLCTDNGLMACSGVLFRIGDMVLGRYKADGRWLLGRVEAITMNQQADGQQQQQQQACDVAYEGAEREAGVASNLLALVERPEDLRAPSGEEYVRASEPYQEGQDVMVRSTARADWRPAVVAAVHDDGTYTVRALGGGKSRLPGSALALRFIVSSGTDSKAAYKHDDKVTAGLLAGTITTRLVETLWSV